MYVYIHLRSTYMYMHLHVHCTPYNWGSLSEPLPSHVNSCSVSMQLLRQMSITCALGSYVHVPSKFASCFVELSNLITKCQPKLVKVSWQKIYIEKSPHATPFFTRMCLGTFIDQLRSYPTAKIVATCIFQQLRHIYTHMHAPHGMHTCSTQYVYIVCTYYGIYIIMYTVIM